MDFATYYKSLKRKEKKLLADELSTSVVYLWQLSSGYRKAGSKMLLSIPKATNGAVTAEMLRPDLYNNQTV